MDIEDIKLEMKELLNDISFVSARTSKESIEEIVYDKSSILLTEKECKRLENIPLTPDLMAYCFSEILGFEVKRRLGEKMDYIVDFDYKGTHASIQHSKLSYKLVIASQYKSEFLMILESVKSLMEQLFTLIGAQSLSSDEFSMKNEAPEYFSKLEFYQERIEDLEQKRKTIRAKLQGKYDVVRISGGECWTPKGGKYLSRMSKEIEYDIEAYIDTFYSAVEHILTLLFPFTTNPGISFADNYLRNSRWLWKDKINSVCGSSLPTSVIDELDRIKEVYRNHNAHGGFSREMMAYIQIPNFGRYPIYIGKKYLKGFVDGDRDSVSYDMYLSSKQVFCNFIGFLDSNFPIPMIIIRSGLPIPVDTSQYTNGITTAEEAYVFVEKMWYELDNQQNMDW